MSISTRNPTSRKTPYNNLNKGHKFFFFLHNQSSTNSDLNVVNKVSLLTSVKPKIV